jgi:GTP-binding protein
MIIDEVTITVEAGTGGNGCLSFRREKYVPRGGPDGGDGGKGGDIFLEARTDVNTLVDFIYRPIFKAHHGEHGKGKNQHGKDTPAITIRVPVGTLVWNENRELIVDMNEDGMKYLIAKGGRGGRGNTTFATSTQQAPKLAERGEPGEARKVRLELKLLADVGIVGFPNAGKSTLLSRVTHAHPKIADYPFTTLEPQLGVVKLSEGRSFVLADVPGLIEGASQGKGLGIRFLRHLERTKLLLHLVDLSTLESYSELMKGIKTIQRELKRHSPKFSKMPVMIVMTKTDSAASKDFLDWIRKFEIKKIKAMAISAVTGKGLNELMEETWSMLSVCKKETAAKNLKPEKTIYQAKTRFQVKKEDEIFYVTGPEIKKWVAMTNFGSRDALERFQKILQRMGVVQELKKRGVKDGDTVFCDGQELTFGSEELEALNDI